MQSISKNVTDNSQIEEVFDEIFKIGNYCLITFDIGFFYVDSKRTKGIFQRQAFQRLQEINEKDYIKYIEFEFDGRDGNDLLNLFYEMMNQTQAIAYAHNSEKVMYLYVSENNVEDLYDLSKNTTLMKYHFFEDHEKEKN